MTSLLEAPRSPSLLNQPLHLAMPSSGAGPHALQIEARLRSMRRLLTGAAQAVRDSRVVEADPLESKLRDRAASLKRMTATVGMYLDREWRTKLFARLDQLLDPEDWDSDFQLPSEQSYSTFLRMIIYLHPTRRPSLGLSLSGHFLSAWVRGGDRIVIECIGNDDVRWVLSRTVDGQRESGAGRVQLHRIPDVTAGYQPEQLFNNGDKLLA
jgi:hypothetical protein